VPTIYFTMIEVLYKPALYSYEPRVGNHEFELTIAPTTFPSTPPQSGWPKTALCGPSQGLFFAASQNVKPAILRSREINDNYRYRLAGKSSVFRRPAFGEKLRLTELADETWTK